MFQFPLSLKDLRLALGLSQEQMAGMLQTTRTKLSMAELGLRPIGAPALFRIQKVNQMLMQVQGLDSDVLSFESKTSDWIEKLKVEHHRMKKKLGKLKSGGTQAYLLGVLLSQMEALQSPDFKSHKDILWKEMIAAAQAEPEETEWKIYCTSIELEVLEWKIERLKGNKPN